MADVASPSYVYGNTIAIGQIIKKRKMMTEGRPFKFIDSMILGNSVVGLVLSLLVVRLGEQELPQIIARNFINFTTNP